MVSTTTTTTKSSSRTGVFVVAGDGSSGGDGVVVIFGRRFVTLDSLVLLLLFLTDTDTDGLLEIFATLFRVLLTRLPSARTDVFVVAGDSDISGRRCVKLDD